MRRTSLIRWQLIPAAFIVATIATACSEETPTEPRAASQPLVTEKVDRSTILTALTCTADVSELQVSCGKLGDDPAASSGTPGQPNILIGNQGVYVTIQTTNVNYNAGTGAFTFDATIRNLIPQPLGTKDTIPPLDTPDANGVRAFFSGGPTVTGGEGVITVVGDGVATFTGPNQPYYQYNTVLDQFEVTAPKTWQLNMPSTVTSFSFLLLVSAEVPRPDGYIDLQVSGNAVTPPTDKITTWFVRNANGTLAGDQTIATWSSSDSTRATVDANGLINPLRAGSTIITAISAVGNRVGSIAITVRPIRRQWTGAVDTNWHTRGNWSPDEIVPVETDTAVIPNSVTNYPSLTQNASIGGLEVMGSPAVVSLGAFDLTASGDVTMPSGGVVTGSVGRLILSGFARTVNGIAPRTRVTGTYSLDANLTVTAPLRVELGRLRNSSFRIRVNP